MALRFIGIDPVTDVNNCLAAFVNEDTADLVIIGSKVTDQPHARGRGQPQPDRGSRVSGAAPPLE